MLTLGSGRGDRALFHDVQSINEELCEDRATYELFCKLTVIAPALADNCADVALDAIIRAGDFSLAAKYSPDPEDALVRASEVLNADVRNLREIAKGKKRRLGAYVFIYCARVRAIIAILEGLGDPQEAQLAREWAVALVDSRPVRQHIEQSLYAA